MKEYKVQVNEYKICWYFNGRLHRENGPAVEYADGTKCWYLNGQRHREDGPAVEFVTGFKEWWVKGKRIPKPNQVKEMTVKEICKALGYTVKIVQ